ncbi:DUF1802 family protein [Ammoniphilus sp. 3BR4]|uniref:DUF1802 family protein n=1 Tax=Ammoniphilus sp. 3BR4 TaxID=3158265 RepID=UPI0034669150
MKVALKEWGVAVKALEEGEQIILLRKGGIQEETKQFELIENRFFLYPTFEHQKVDLVKPQYEPDFFDSMNQWDSRRSTVQIRVFAEAVDDIEVFDEDKVRALSPCHIWVDNVAEDRLKWKKQQPLHVLLLRVYKLPKPVVVPIHESYQGCKSWHELLQDIDADSAKPVLSDEKFAEKVLQIRSLLAD